MSSQSSLEKENKAQYHGSSSSFEGGCVKEGGIFPMPQSEEHPDINKSAEERAEIVRPCVKFRTWNLEVLITSFKDRKLIRRLDWMLIPWLCVLYLASFLDRKTSHFSPFRQFSSNASPRCQHWQCQDRRPPRRPQHVRHAIQHRPHRLLLLLFPL